MLIDDYMMHFEYHIEYSNECSDILLGTTFLDYIEKTRKIFNPKTQLRFLSTRLWKDNYKSFFPSYKIHKGKASLSLIDYMKATIIAEMNNRISGDDLIRASYMLTYYESSGLERFNPKKGIIEYGDW